MYKNKQTQKYLVHFQTLLQKKKITDKKQEKKNQI